MKTLCLRGVELGAGAPKIAVPLVGRTRRELLEAAAAIAPLPADLVEWRADFYEQLADEAAVCDMLRALREALDPRPLIFTIRTAREGGAAALDAARYTALTLAAARSGCADLIDVELSLGADAAERLMAGIHAAGRAVIGSCHDFSTTPPRETMLARLRDAQAMGADIPKLAVMARGEADTLALLDAALAFRDGFADRPFIAISMGPHGVLSRFACALTGSCLTFGAAEHASAPGQLPVGILRALLDAIPSVQ